MRRIFIPGTGWDSESVISGFIKVREHPLVEQSIVIINAFEFDDIYPFTNIFWGASPAAYGFPVIGFAGSYKQIEEDWNEWMWKFSQLLSHLDAVEARVSLSCILGNFNWKLEPKLRFDNRHSRDTMQGQVWGITESPEPDFSTDPVWLAHFSDKKYGLVERWDKSV
jgi:hypothetical protein